MSLVVPVCPSCGEHYQLSEAARAPQSLTCGHALCLECVEAVLLMGEPTCVICKSVVEAISVSDTGLGAFAEHLLRLSGELG